MSPVVLLVGLSLMMAHVCAAQGSNAPDAPSVAVGQLRVVGDVTLGADAITIDRLKLELDRMAVTGRFAYAWASDSRSVSPLCRSTT